MAARDHGLTYSAACERPSARCGWLSKFRPRACIATSGYNPHGLMIEYDKCSADPVYGWFTEGFDTLDLKEAKALLAELES